MISVFHNALSGFKDFKEKLGSFSWRRGLCLCHTSGLLLACLGTKWESCWDGIAKA